MQGTPTLLSIIGHVSFLMGTIVFSSCKSNPVDSGCGFPAKAGPILFISDKGGTNQLYSMNEDGSSPQQLTSDPRFSNLNSKWSPASSMIAWTTDNGIELMNADGSNQHDLYGEKASQSSWSSDSREIVFSKFSPSRDKGVLWIINLDGTGLRPITV